VTNLQRVSERHPSQLADPQRVAGLRTQAVANGPLIFWLFATDYACLPQLSGSVRGGLRLEKTQTNGPRINGPWRFVPL